jgi:hypothetical protein
MSIKSDVKELESIRLELRMLNDKRRRLKEKESICNERINAYLKNNNLPGLKHDGSAIIIEEREKHSIKPKKEKKLSSMEVLTNYGLNEKDAEKVLNELSQAVKGEAKIVPVLKFKKYST